MQTEIYPPYIHQIRRLYFDHMVTYRHLLLINLLYQIICLDFKIKLTLEMEQNGTLTYLIALLIKTHQ